MCGSCGRGSRAAMVCPGTPRDRGQGHVWSSNDGVHDVATRFPLAVPALSGPWPAYDTDTRSNSACWSIPSSTTKQGNGGHLRRLRLVHTPSAPNRRAEARDAHARGGGLPLVAVLQEQSGDGLGASTDLGRGAHTPQKAPRPAARLLDPREAAVELGDLPLGRAEALLGLRALSRTCRRNYRRGAGREESPRTHSAHPRTSSLQPERET